jgi:transposase
MMVLVDGIKMFQVLPMRIRTLLNRCHYLKSFVYEKEQLEPVAGMEALVVEVVPRKNGRGICSHCQRQAPGYDVAAKARLFAFVPVWGFSVYLRYRMRRVNCTDCGIKVEQVPWAEGKSPRTRALEVFLARWARRLSWSEVAQVFQMSWEQVYRSVCAVVQYGLAQRSLDGIGAIGVDEVQCGRGHDYMTVVYQLDGAHKRLLHVARRRTVKSFLSFFRVLTAEQVRSIRFVCSDMWKAYLKVIAKKCPHALHILDRFHVVAQLNKAVDQVRREEARRLRTQGYEDVLNHGRYCFLKNPDNLTDKQRIKLDDLLQYDLKSVRAYLLKESFQAFWHYQSPQWAQWFLRKWCARAMRSQLKPIKQFVKTLRRHEPLLMNYFKAKKAFSSGAVEGLNRKINLVTRKSYGFRNFEIMKIALYHTMGQLPEPPLTHRFC